MKSVNVVPHQTSHQTVQQHSPSSWLAQLQRQPVIAVIRAAQVELGLQMAQAVAQGGIHFIEITWNSAEPVALLKQVQQALPACCVGVGTLLTVADLDVAIATGAAFCVSPHTSVSMIQTARQADVPMIPGAMTPTEIVTAWEAGATAVKVFPIATLGGPTYLNALQGPLGHIPLMPTGGVDIELAIALLKAGATAVGLSSALFPKNELAQHNWLRITERAAQLVAQCSPSA